jgi:hypothetical protein
MHRYGFIKFRQANELRFKRIRLRPHRRQVSDYASFVLKWNALRGLRYPYGDTYARD